MLQPAAGLFRRESVLASECRWRSSAAL